MKNTRSNKQKHPVKFIRVLNQPATWIEIDMTESPETVSDKYLKQIEVNKVIPHLIK